MQLNIKKVLFTTGTVAIMFGSIIAPTFAFAAGGGYGSQPGYINSGADTGSCAGHGAFGAFSGTANDGQQGSAVHGLVLADQAAGISLGSETGPANSSFSQTCGV